MRVAIRADASVDIGIGHVMRCLNLATVLRERGCEVCFLCRSLVGHAEAIIRNRGFDVVLLPASSRFLSPPVSVGHELENDMREDARLTCRTLSEQVEWLVADHYGLDARWHRIMRSRARRILVIDDLANRPYDADVLLDQNAIYRQEIRYRDNIPSHCRCLLGPQYALLGQAFSQHARSVRDRSQWQRVLIFFGGGDAADLTRQAVLELAPLGLEMDVVIGAANPHRQSVARQCREARAVLHIQTDQMAALMARADLFVGAGGTTHWERCALGLPAVTVAVAENQEAVSRLLAEKQTCRYLGRHRNMRPGRLREAVDALMSDAASLKLMSNACREVVQDGDGAQRVVDVMFE